MQTLPLFQPCPADCAAWSSRPPGPDDIYVKTVKTVIPYDPAPHDFNTLIHDLNVMKYNVNEILRQSSISVEHEKLFKDIIDQLEYHLIQELNLRNQILSQGNINDRNWVNQVEKIYENNHDNIVQYSMRKILSVYVIGFIKNPRVIY